MNKYKSRNQEKKKEFQNFKRLKEKILDIY